MQFPWITYSNWIVLDKCQKNFTFSIIFAIIFMWETFLIYNILYIRKNDKYGISVLNINVTFDIILR